jgi:hypothetical protein
MSQTPEKYISDAEKITKFESKIADMEAWQDDLEESLHKYQSEEDKKETALNRQFWNGIASYYQDLAEENNLPADIKNELINFLEEKGLEERGLQPGDPGLDAITQKHDELIYELLSDTYPAYKEHLKVHNERNYVREFRRNIMTIDNQRDKQQERSLIAAIYNEKQGFMEKNREEIQELNDENDFNIEKLKEGIELQKKLHNRFIDSSENILSESQLKELQKYLDPQISSMEEDFKRYEAVSRLQEDLSNRHGTE